jgi:long-chain acyl-CoA synthetase
MLYQILKGSAALYPDNTAVRCYGECHSYAEVCGLVDRLAAGLSRCGLGEGDRLGVFLYNRLELILCYFACFRIGAIAVPVNYRLKSDEVEYILNHSAPRLLVSEPELFPEVAVVRDRLASVEHCFLVDTGLERPADTLPFDELLQDAGADDPPPRCTDGKDAVILYTSGTTGRPKGTLLNHKQLAIHTNGHCDLVGYGRQDCTLVSLALSNNFAFSHQLLAAFRCGATLEIIRRYDADEVLDRIRNTGVTMLYMMPVMYHGLIRHAEAAGGPIPNGLRAAIVAGDTTPFIVFEGFEQLFGLELCEGIGMTETQIYALNPLAHGKKLGSVGKPVPYQEVSVQGPQGTAMLTGQVGEIVVRGSIVTQGYLNNPEASARSFFNGWFLTGDLGCFDADGYLWFRGRKKQLIVHDGSNISPQEVEEVLYHHPAVSEVGVTGVPDPVEGENVRAFVVLKPQWAGLSEASLLDFARHHLADYKLPERIFFINALPKGATGKVDRAGLKALVG